MDFKSLDNIVEECIRIKEENKQLKKENEELKQRFDDIFNKMGALVNVKNDEFIPNVPPGFFHKRPPPDVISGTVTRPSSLGLPRSL